MLWRFEADRDSKWDFRVSVVASRSALRILQINTADIGAGAEKSALNLFRGFRTRGLDSWLAVGRKLSDDPDVFPVANGLWARLTRVEESVNASRRVPRQYIKRALRRLHSPRRIIERQLGIEDFHHRGAWRLLELPPQPPSIVHCHNLHGNYFDLRALPYLSAQVPVLLNLRDTWSFTGHCAQPLGCERWVTGCGSCPDLTIAPRVLRDATAYNWRRKHDIYVASRLYLSAPSQWLADLAQRSMLGGVQCRVIPNGIDLAVFRPGDRDQARRILDVPAQARVVLLTAHSGFKDLDTMEAALSRVAVDSSLPLLFICLGRRGSERALGAGRIRYTGFEWDEQRTRLYYQASDVYLHVAKGEAFGKTITEAMACGVPVVAGATGGIPEQIVNGVTGLLVPPTDVEALGKAIELLLATETMRRKMGDAAAARAKDHYSLDRQLDAFLDYYNDISADWQEWRRQPRPTGGLR
jgi:glycosyltransferase involved in cell wall biosynthesis